MTTQTTPTPAETLAAAQATLTALEAEAAALPDRIKEAARAGDTATVAELSARAAAIPHLVAAAREEVQRLRLPALDEAIVAMEAELAAAGAEYQTFIQQVDDLQRQIEAVRRASQPAYSRQYDARLRLDNLRRQRAELVRALGLEPAGRGVDAAGVNQVIPARQWRDDPRLSSGGVHIVGA